MSVVINGSAGLTTNSGAVYNGISSGTAVTASGTSVDFTSIPSWVKRITVMFNGVSTSGTSFVIIQIGSTTFTTSGYVSQQAAITSVGAIGSGGATAGFIVASFGAAADTFSGVATIVNITSNTWQLTSTTNRTNNVANTFSSGNGLALGGTLDRVRITTVNGTDTFDAGSINILYE